MSAPPNATLANFSDHYRGLLRFLTQRTGCQETAKDLAHDTWVRLAERENAHPVLAEPNSDTRAYLYTVAANLASNLRRHQERGAERFVGDDGATQAAHPASDIVQSLSLRQAIIAIEAALQALPARCRNIFLAHRIEGLDHEALALQYGISVKTVERDILMAMDTLHATLVRWRGDGPAKAKRHGRRKALSALLATTGIGTGTHWIWRQWRDSVATFTLSLQTPNAHQRTEDLPDGSTLVLDAASQAEVVFHAHHRKVRLLRGNAFFAVAHDSARPFTVDTALARITVLGTRFSVELGDEEVLVAVETGRVQVTTLQGSAIELIAGQHKCLGACGVQVPSANHGPFDVASWREGWLNFPGVPLAAVVQRLARYCAYPIRVAPAAAHLSVLARVRIANTGEWLLLLPRSLPVQVRVLADRTVDITPRF